MKSMAEIFRFHAVVDLNGVHTNGTDKQTNHAYGNAYEKLFPDRNGVKMMMEVGVADGSSLCAWRDIFPNALCVGMDIHHSDKAHGDRIEFRIGDQRVQRDCENAAAGRQFDFIVEDATHQLPDTLLTLLYLWPFIKIGGLYVVEEFCNSASLVRNIKELWPFAEVIEVGSPFGGKEQLVAFRKVWKLHETA